MVSGIVAACHGIPGRVDLPLLDPFLGLVKGWYPKSHIIPLAFAGPKHRSENGGGHCRVLTEALGRLADAGARRVAVQPLYVVAGEEYDALASCLAASGEAAGLEATALGEPLLARAGDVREAAKALVADLTPLREPGRAVVLMGHGSLRPAHEAYAALARDLDDLAPWIVLATLRLEPASELSIQSVRDKLVSRGVVAADLVPLTFRVGAHARSDMAGDKPGSFASVLGAAGIACRPVMVGLGSRQAVLGVWRDRLGRAMARLDHPKKAH